ncbi:MAG: hypothetical protein JW891_04675 [Candidatus Lokiarchaeota archaeon]|nr:hypothetical protein [Candidatus Lokiarchaeota archaeon]
MNKKKTNLILISCILVALSVTSISCYNNSGWIESISSKPSFVYYEDGVYAYDVDVSGNYAYVVGGYLQVVDISDPTKPENIATSAYITGASVDTGVVVSGNYAYIAAGTSGLAVIDITDPKNPGTPIYEPTTSNAQELCVRGNYAYIAEGSSGLTIVNISNPSDPITLETVNTDGATVSVYVSGNYAYIADVTTGLAIIDISDPTHPGTPEYRNIFSNAWDVCVSGNYAFLAVHSGLAVINITDPTNPRSPIYRNTTSNAVNVRLDGDYAYLTTASSGLAVFNISNPLNPVIIAYEEELNYPFGFDINGNHAYICLGDNPGLAVLDISEHITPGDPVQDTSRLTSIFIDGDIAYAGGLGSLGLAVFDISNPKAPKFIGSENTTGVLNLYVDGDIAYTVDGGTSLSTLNVSDPTNPQYITTESFYFGAARDIFIEGDLAYIIGTLGLNIMNISDPTNPELISYRYTNGSSQAIYISGDCAFIADGDEGLAIIDISDPENPGIPVYENLTGRARDIHVDGDYAYVTADDSGLAIINITDLSNPELITYASMGFGPLAKSVYISGDFAYVTDGGGSDFFIFEISDPTNPITWYEHSISTGINRVLVNGDYAFFAGSNGLFILQVRQRWDMNDPILLDKPSDFSVNWDYTGINLSWTVSNENVVNYTIFLEGTGVVEGPTPWFATNPIVYDIPDGLPIGIYNYQINITDFYGNSIIDDVSMLVEYNVFPVITSSPSDLSLDVGYTNASISWTATDTNPLNYTISREGTGIVAGPSPWGSGVPIEYNITSSLPIGVYVYTLNLTDDHGHYTTDTFIFTVKESDEPVITNTQPDFSLDVSYSGESISWTATDEYPCNYTIELEGTGIVAGPSPWTSGNPIIYNIPEGLPTGTHIYIVNFTDDFGNFITDSATLTISESINPELTIIPSDLTINLGYTGKSISWTATDEHPCNYTIELEGTGIVAGPTSWVSGEPITYTVPEGLTVGTYNYTITIYDDFGNSVSDSILLTVNQKTGGNTISFGNWYFLVFFISLTSIVIYKIRKPSSYQSL